MRRDVWVAGLLLLAACDQKPVAAPDPCRAPTLTPTNRAGTYAGESERTSICIKLAVHAIARQGGPLETIAQDAVTRCSGQENAEIAALAKGERVYPWETAQIHEKLQHLALLTARQLRAKGCGRAPGEAADDP
jgi:hypothetical protein